MKKKPLLNASGIRFDKATTVRLESAARRPAKPVPRDPSLILRLAAIRSFLSSDCWYCQLAYKNITELIEQEDRKSGT